MAAAAAHTQGRQSGKAYRTALIDPGIPTQDQSETGYPIYRGFFKELRQRGYVGGRTLIVERIFGGGPPDQYPEFAREVVGRKPDLIFIVGTRFLPAFKAATSSIPLVAIMNDPVRFGLAAASMARPGVTADAGIGALTKYVEFLTAPKISKLGFLASRSLWQTTPIGTTMEEAAHKARLPLIWSSDGPLQEDEYPRAFDVLVHANVDGIIVLNQPENWVHRRLILDWIEKSRLPAIYMYTDFVELGGLMSYEVDRPGMGRQAAITIDQIFKGANPSEIPISQPSKYELSINLKTAKSLGFDIPSSLLVRADKVIE